MNLDSLRDYPNREDFVRTIGEEVFANELASHGCAQVIVHTFFERLGEKNPVALKAAAPFFAGLALTGHVCGGLVGSLMVLGTVFGREDISQGMPGLLAGVRPLRRQIKLFGQDNEGKFNCEELTGVDMASPQDSAAYFEAGGLERCAGIMRQAAETAAGLIYDHWQETAGDQG